MPVNSKTRLLHLLKYLYEQTDEDHQITTTDIERHFSELGTVVDCKTVVALVNNENTLKRYYRDETHRRIRLHPENPDMKDIYVRNCRIQGVASHVIKRLQGVRK